MSLSPGARIRLLSPAIIAVLAAIVVTGAFSLMVVAYPFQLSDLQWRGTMMKATLSSCPQVGFLLVMIMLTGIHGGQYRAVRWGAILSLLTAAIMLVGAPLYLLDVLSARRLQQQSAMGRFTHEGLALTVTSVAVAVVLIFAARRAFISIAVDPEQRKTLGADLVVAQGDEVS